MNVILFGPPGAGKGTQAKYLVKQLKSFQISTGDMLRDEIQKNSEIGKKIVEDMSDGKFVSDEIVNSLIEKVIFDPDKKNKLIFDGYPRSLTQAKNLDKLLEKTNQKINSIFWLEFFNNISKFLAWLKDLGYPSNINLFFFLGSKTTFFIKSLTISSVAKSPFEIVFSISLPISVLFFTSVLKRSPVETWKRFNLFTILMACVPLPAPGGPKIITFT